MRHKKNELIWGEDPELFGPKDWFRNTLMIRELRKYRTEGSILDYGCGTGILLRRLDKIGFKTTGLDISEPNLRYIQHHIKIFHQKPVLILGDNTALANTRKHYDAIVCGETLEHIKDDRKIISLFHSLLVPRGICVISVPAHKNRFSDIDTFAGHYRRYEKQALIQLFTSQKFTVKNLYSWGFPLGYFWDKTLSEPILRKKMNTNQIFTNSNSILGKLMKFEQIKKFCSNVFWFDQLFNSTERGNGWILTAQKNA